MDNKIKEKWVEALTSGEYLQGEGALRTSDNKFCCLGVLCDIVGVRWTGHAGSNHCIEAEGPQGQRSLYSLPEDIRQKLGISIRVQAKLADMNDHGMSFKRIAAAIKNRRNW